MTQAVPSSGTHVAAPSRPMEMDTAHGVGLAEAFKVWVRVALLSFGGPVGQIAIMHRIIVEELRWVSEARFLHALNYCHLLPGPEAQQLAIYIGWLMHRTLGGLIAGVLFVVPGVVALMALSLVYVTWGNVDVVAGLLFGLKAAVLAVVVEAVLRVGRRALKSRVAVAIAAAAFAALFFFAVPFPVVVLAAAAAGFVADRSGYTVGSTHSRGEHGDDLLGETMPAHAQPSTSRALRVASVWLPLWLGPVVLLLALLGPGNVFTQLALFFSAVAVVSFGGAYAVLAYVAQEAVQTYHWLAPGEMLTGLGLAETTPGPLIMVVQHVGFLAGYRAPGALPPLPAGVLAGLLVTWVTFTPCFLWVFLGAPYVEALRGVRALGAALSAVTAAVVGVIVNLAVWFGVHVIFQRTVSWHGYGLALDIPVLGSLDPFASVLAVAAALALLRFRIGVIPTLLGCSIAGVAFQLAFGGVR
ncbi:chromate efflux transporter [Limobrevibacterium gyesilva]|uniref:Chromate efflux transporter n=2 Tax=Limobrevibacterium gyesilva TaxID=2991712 RepID=A0AA42CIX2_9PROT|nr:chromate efflux transporter [Limobrevibacterium gyesilva]MCW3476372.1 chromate efflux transporter [Limobrevibacterium gyesilva]